MHAFRYNRFVLNPKNGITENTNSYNRRTRFIHDWLKEFFRNSEKHLIFVSPPPPSSPPDPTMIPVSQDNHVVAMVNAAEEEDVVASSSKPLPLRLKMRIL